MSKKVKASVYQKIALDIASRIAEGEFSVGDKMYARTSIANRYNVSPETARRAVNMLSDLEIVETLKGSGFIIKSSEKAVNYLRNFSYKQTVKALISDIKESLKGQINETTRISNNFDNLLENTGRFQPINPFVPFEIIITRENKYLNKTAADVRFWENTNATIIAIKRDNNIILSPGPYAEFKENDTYYFIGDENSYIRVKEFMYVNK